MRNISPALIIVFYLLTYCNRVSEIHPVTISLDGINLTTDVSLDAFSGLFFLRGLALLTHRSGHNISVVDSLFQLRFEYGQEGAGPGEFLRINSVSVNDNYIYVHDSSKFNIQVFTHDFKLLNTIPLEARVLSIAVSGDNTIYATTFEMNSWSFIELQGESNKTLYIGPTSDPSHGITQLSKHGDYLLISRIMTNRYSVFDLNTKRLRHFSNPYLSENPPFKNVGGHRLPESPVWRRGWIYNDHIYQYYTDDGVGKYYISNMEGRVLKNVILDGVEGYLHYRGTDIVEISEDKVTIYPLNQFEILQ